MKTCRKCLTSKPLEDFPARRDAKDGRRNDCKACWLEYKRQWDAPRKSALRAYAQTYYSANKAVLNERSRAYQAAEENAERMRVLRSRAKAKRKARLAGVEHQPYTRSEIFERDGGRCRGCDVELTDMINGFDIDHIVPVSLGGPDIPANVQLMCGPCNGAKWATLEGQIHLPV